MLVLCATYGSLEEAREAKSTSRYTASWPSENRSNSVAQKTRPKKERENLEAIRFGSHIFGPS